MGRGEHILSDLLIYGIAISLAASIVLAPQRAKSGAYDTDRPAASAPRWSNDDHHAREPVARPNCMGPPPGASVEYVPGRDAEGRPVAPADLPRTLNGAPAQVEIEVSAGKERPSGRSVDISAGGITYDLRDNSLNGHSATRDCTRSFK